MPVTLHVRNLPDDVHAKLKQRAKDEGLFLSEYVARELAALVSTKSNREIVEWAKAHPILTDITSDDIVQAIHDGRQERDDAIWSSIHRPDFGMTIPASEARQNWAETLQSAAQEPVTITQHGRDSVVIMDAALAERALTALEDAQDIAAAQAARAEMEAGATTIPLEEFAAELDGELD